MLALVRTLWGLKQKRWNITVIKYNTDPVFRKPLLRHNEMWWHQYHDRREFPQYPNTKLSGAPRFSFWWSQDTLSRERLSISQRQIDLVAPRRLCCTPGGQELRETVRERNRDIPEISCPVVRKSGMSSDLSGSPPAQTWSRGRSGRANFTYSQTQMQRQKHVWGCLGWELEG